MKWTKSQRKKLTAIIHPHKADPPDFYPSAEDAWARTGLPGAPQTEPDPVLEHLGRDGFDPSIETPLAQFWVAAFGVETAIRMLRARAEAAPFPYLEERMEPLRRYLYRMEQAEFDAVKTLLFEGAQIKHPGRAAFILGRDEDFVRDAINATKGYPGLLMAVAPTAELALEILERADGRPLVFLPPFDLVENLGTAAVPVLEAILERYPSAMASWRKSIEQALRIAGGAAAPKKKPARKTAKASPEPSAKDVADGFSGYVVAGSASGGKFWEVVVEGAAMRIRYGKLGSEPAWSTTTLDSPEKAIKEAKKKLSGKVRKGYVAAPRPVPVVPAAAPLAQSHVAGVFYFRALDRRPGGNIDTTTIKLTFRAGPGTQPTLTARQAANFDGQQYAYGEAPVTLDLSTTASTVLEAAQAMLDAGLVDTSFTILDPRVDKEAYDTEWSSIELKLYELPSAETPAEDGRLVLQFAQKALSFKKQPGNPPDERSQAFLHAVQELSGIGRVQDLPESPFNSAYGAPGTEVGALDAKAELPLYL